jgi:hypothetical protein
MSSAPITCDVLVVGGGASGVAAASAAGRAGARVILLERYGFLGGLATAAQVGTICGLYLRDTTGTKAVPVAAGFPQEFALQLERATGSKPIQLPTGLWVLPYVPPAFARAADAIVSALENISVILHATVSEALTEGARINQVRALVWNEPLLFAPKTVVDCTGEATSAALAGAAVENGATDQVPALVFVLENIDPGLVQRGLIEVRREVRRGVESGTLPALCEQLSVVPGTGSNGRLALKLSLAAGSADIPLWQQISAWERQSRALIGQLHQFLVANVAACRNARLDSITPQLGVRSGRRIRGRARLADENVLGAQKSAAGIARGAWPMERWCASPKPEMTFFAERDYYDIPLDCLRPVELDNTWVAGRCLSADAGAMTSARVIGTALATGWAVGTAAAFQSQGRSLDGAVAEIRRQMDQ